jgi:hypothetical protein
MDWNDDLWVEPAIPQSGKLRPPESPGHGLVFKSDLLKSQRVGGSEVSAKV